MLGRDGCAAGPTRFLRLQLKLIAYSHVVCTLMPRSTSYVYETTNGRGDRQCNTYGRGRGSKVRRGLCGCSSWTKMNGGVRQVEVLLESTAR